MSGENRQLPEDCNITLTVNKHTFIYGISAIISDVRMMAVLFHRAGTRRAAAGTTEF